MPYCQPCKKQIVDMDPTKTECSDCAVTSGLAVVPRWALDFVLDRGCFQDEGPAPEGWSSDEMYRALETLRVRSPIGKPPKPITEADKGIAADWYTWGFQAGLDAARS